MQFDHDRDSLFIDLTSETVLRSHAGDELPVPEPFEYVSGAVPPKGDDISCLLKEADTGSLVLPAALPLIAKSQTEPLVRSPIYGCDLTFSNELRRTHLLVVGLTGSGKNVRVMDNLRLSAIRDPNATVVSFSLKTADYGVIEEACKESNKPLHVVNLSNAWRSLGWNPLDTKDANKAFDVCRRVADSTKNPYSTDSEFWVQWIKTAFMGAYEAGYRSFPEIHSLFGLAYSDLLPLLKESGSVNLENLASFIENGSHNADTVLASIRAGMHVFHAENVSRIMSRDELKLDKLFAKPCCLHIEVPEAELESYLVLYQILARTVIDEAIGVAEESGRDACPVTVFFDDLPSLGNIISVARLLTLRSRNIGVVAGCQSLASLTHAYGQSSEAFLEAFSNKIVLPGCAQRDAEYFSHMSGEQVVAMPTLVDGPTQFLTRRALSATDIRSPSYEHYLLGKPATLFVGPISFQAYLQRSFELLSNRRIFHSAAQVTGKERLRKRRLGKKKVLAPNRKDAPNKKTVATNIQNWTENQIQDYMKGQREKLDWPNTTGSAKKWWETFEAENDHRRELVVRLMDELVNRDATIQEFFLSYVYSNTDNIQANLHYLDYARLKKKEESEKRRKAK